MASYGAGNFYGGMPQGLTAEQQMAWMSQQAAAYNAKYGTDVSDENSRALEALRQQQADKDRAEKAAELDKTLAHQSGESAAERAARIAELVQTQSGAKDLAGYQSGLQNETEKQRFARAQIEQGQSRDAINSLLTRFGFDGGQNQTATGAQSMPGGAGMGVMTSGAAGAAGGGAPSAEIAAEDAAFARAKDKVGQVNEAAQQGVSEDMAARGITGSGVQAAAMAQGAQAGAGRLADVAQQGALETLKRRYQVSDRDAALASTKRGQDIGLVQSLSGALKPSGSGGGY